MNEFVLPRNVFVDFLDSRDNKIKNAIVKQHDSFTAIVVIKETNERIMISRKQIIKDGV
jgi:hypothetical protein